MPSPDRIHPMSRASGSSSAQPPRRLSLSRDDLVAALVDSELAHVVDFVAYADGDHVVVAAARGVARYSLTDLDAAGEVVSGEDPVGWQDPLAFTPIEAELDRPRPGRNSYPLAARRLASFFNDRRAPDIAVVHTDEHYWPDRGGHIGEHGSLSVLQSRAPLILSGAGVAAHGLLDSSARVVDVAPMLAQMSGVAPPPELDGAALDFVTGAPHVVGILWDGANCNSLLDLAARGELPNVARLLERGCAFAGGAVAEFPSSTLANHTAALTGVGPGRHGIVGNAYYDRELDEHVIPNDQSTWHYAMQWLRPGVTTVFDWLAAAGTTSLACVNEPVDCGATYSTFDLVRSAGHQDGAKSMTSALPDPTADPLATQRFVSTNKAYAWSTQVDGLGLTQMLDVWSAKQPPRLTWWNNTLTDSGHHEGGPHSDLAHASLRDADRRLGVFLDHVEQRGLFDETAFLLTSDHGSVGSLPDCRGDWEPALRATGVAYRDVAYGFIYLER